MDVKYEYDPLVLLSPSETKLKDELGDKAVFSSLPEECGADISLFTRFAVIHLQRKEIPTDFILSIDDGRMTKSIARMKKQENAFRRVILEGKFNYRPDKTLFVSRKIKSHWTENMINGVLFNIEYVHNTPIIQTDDVKDTADYILRTLRLSCKSKHLGLCTIPNAPGKWSIPDEDEQQLWILQSFHGIGPATASSIIQHFGTIPLNWTCTLKELQKVRGLSPAKAKDVYEVLTKGKNPDQQLSSRSISDMRKLISKGE